MLKIGIALTVINLVLMIFLLSELKPASAQQQIHCRYCVAGVSEIVDSPW
jgi:hypothetical protein